jgi:hypothetical protein
MLLMRWTPFVWLATLVTATPAWGQQAPVSSALFNQGLKEMLAGDYVHGCPRIAESQRMDPRPGTMFTLAECEARWGRFASAVAHYADYLRAVERMPQSAREKQAERVSVATSQTQDLGPKIPRVVLTLPLRAPRGITVRQDDMLIGEPALGIELPVDPGEHVIHVQLPSGAVREQRFRVQPGERLDIVLLLPTGSEPTSTQPSGSHISETNSIRPASSRRTWAYAIGGVGVAGIALGAVTGLMTMSRKATIENNCQDIWCTAEGKSAADEARTTGAISTVAFGVGLAGIAAAAVLLLTDPTARKADPSRASVAPWVEADARGGWVGLRGAY